MTSGSKILENEKATRHTEAKESRQDKVEVRELTSRTHTLKWQVDPCFLKSYNHA